MSRRLPMGQQQYLRVDVHTHILPESWTDMKSKCGYGGWVQLRSCPGSHGKRASMFRDDGTPFRDVEDNLWSLETRIRDCDRIGIDVHVLSTVPVMFSYWAKKEDCLFLCEELNNHISKCVSNYPDRFVGLGTIPMQSSELAIQELRRCKYELGLAGIQIGSHIETNRYLGAPINSDQDLTLSDSCLFAIFKECEALDMAVFVHPWDMMGSRLMKNYFLPWLVGMPAESSLAICSMIFGGIFQRLPLLRVLFAHGGGSFPFTLGRIQHGFDVRPDLCAKDCSISPKAHLGKFWADSLVHDKRSLDTIVSIYGENKVCLGSDYPFPLGEFTAESRGTEYCAGALIDSMGRKGVGDENGEEEEVGEGVKVWTDERKKKVLGSNACEWLGIDEKRFFMKRS
jgi:aminocarboxymuconate-semialdehyde decarboxylase